MDSKTSALLLKELYEKVGIVRRESIGEIRDVSNKEHTGILKDTGEVINILLDVIVMMDARNKLDGR